MRAILLTAVLMCVATAAIAESDPRIIPPNAPQLPPRTPAPSNPAHRETQPVNAPPIATTEQILNGISTALASAQQLMGSYLMLQSIDESERQQNVAKQAAALTAQIKARDEFWAAWCGKHPGCDLSQPDSGERNR